MRTIVSRHFQAFFLSSRISLFCLLSLPFSIFLSLSLSFSISRYLPLSPSLSFFSLSLPLSVFISPFRPTHFATCLVIVYDLSAIRLPRENAPVTL